MKHLYFILLLASGALASSFTELVELKGYIKTAGGHVLTQPRQVLVYQGKEFLKKERSTKAGAYSLKFYPGDGLNVPLFFYAVGPAKDTLLMAALSGFSNEGLIKGNFFLPLKGAAAGILCPACRRADRLFTLVYRHSEQKDFDCTAARFFCSREKLAF